MPAERHIPAAYLPKSTVRPARAVTELADSQYGVVSLAQLLGRGMSQRAVSHWVASGRLQRIHQNVFAVGHRALRREGHWMAAVLAGGFGAVLSHRSAAALHDIRRSSGSATEVTVAGRTGRSRPGLRVHSGNRLSEDEFEAVKGVPATTPARTLIDLAAVVGRRDLERACERAERLELFDLYAVARLLARHRGRRGVARLRGVLLAWDADLMLASSELEVLYLRLLLDSDTERPIVNGRLHLGEHSFEVDFHWPRQRLVVETDGKAFHDNPLARARDVERDRALTAGGWRVQRFGWNDVTHAPQHTLQTTRALLQGEPTSWAER